jgi:uncharacterized protein YjbJ (UPF0337 family)
MRPTTVLVACIAVFLGGVPAIVQAQMQGQMVAENDSVDAKAIWEKIKGSWNQTKGAVKEQWGKLTDDDLLEIEGRRDQLIGKIQVRYGYTREQAEESVGSWEQTRARDM